MMARASVGTPAQTLAADIQAARLHKGRHGKDKKDLDPFLGLPNDAVTLPPSSNGRENMTVGQSRSFLADFILTPINMISLLLSLFLVDYGDRQWRLSQHRSGSDASHQSAWSWLDPEPYQTATSTWQPDRRALIQNGFDSSFQGWYRKTKHREIAKLELSDALEIRGRVMVALTIWILLSLLGVAFGVQRLYIWMSL